jgi:type II secretory pathway predicted ATPase ExeA
VLRERSAEIHSSLLRLGQYWLLDGVTRVGLPDLRRRLSRNVLSSLAARLPVRIQLEGIGAANVAAYLSHRLKLAGCSKDVFAEDAILMITEATSGALRKIDVLAGHALEVASEGKSAIVDAGVVERAVERCAEALL